MDKNYKSTSGVNEGQQELNIPNLWDIALKTNPMNIRLDNRLQFIILHILTYSFEQIDKETYRKYNRKMMTELNEAFGMYPNFAQVLVDEILLKQNFLGYLILQDNYELEYTALHNNTINDKYLYIYLISRILNKDHGIYLVQFLDKIKDDVETLALISNFIIRPFLQKAIYEKENSSIFGHGLFTQNVFNNSNPQKNPSIIQRFRNRNKTVPQQIAHTVSQNIIKPEPIKIADTKSPTYNNLLKIIIKLLNHALQIQNTSLNGLFSKYKILLQFNNIFNLYYLHENDINKYIWYYIVKPKFNIFPVKEWLDFTKSENNEIPNIQYLNNHSQLMLSGFNVKGPLNNDYLSSVITLIIEGLSAKINEPGNTKKFMNDIKAFKVQYETMKKNLIIQQNANRAKREEQRKRMEQYFGNAIVYPTHSSSAPKMQEISNTYANI